MEYLIVDGYNVIGASAELSIIGTSNLEEARLRLIEKLAEYSSSTGQQVIVVFDAHLSKGAGSSSQHNNVRVEYTKENLTADEYIEKNVLNYISRKNTVRVATSDSIQQSVIFSKGALRMSARELWLEIKQNDITIRENLKSYIKRRSSLAGVMAPEVFEELEKIRRSK